MGYGNFTGKKAAADHLLGKFSDTGSQVAAIRGECREGLDGVIESLCAQVHRVQLIRRSFRGSPKKLPWGTGGTEQVRGLLLNGVELKGKYGASRKRDGAAI